MRLTILLISILLLFNSCDFIASGIKTFSTVKQEVQKKKIQEEDQKINESLKLKDGEKKYYYANGNIKSIVNYCKGKKIGISQTYYKSGEKQYDIPYQDGMKHGKVIWYYKSGKIYRETQYKKGKKNGYQRKYWESGKLKSEMMYFDNLLSTGLKEVSNTGKVKKMPVIKVEKINRLKETGEYWLKMKLSNGRSKVQFYLGDLIDGKYFPADGRGFMAIDTKNGVAVYKIRIGKGEQLIGDFKLVAIETTAYQNKRLLHKNIPLNIRNAN